MQFTGLLYNYTLDSFVVISGIADIYVKEYRPPGFDEEKKYAVLFSVWVSGLVSIITSTAQKLSTLQTVHCWVNRP